MGARIGILGSCVTRDIWMTTGAPASAICCFFARSSIPSLVAPATLAMPIPEPPSAIKVQFEDRCLRADILKLALPEMEAARPDVLIFDFVDERFDLKRVGDTIISAGWTYAKSGLSDVEPFASGRIIERLSDEAEALWREGLDALHARMRDGPLRETKVVLHRAYWATRSVTEDGGVRPMVPRARTSARRRVARFNIMLESYYDMFCKRFPQACVIEPSAALRVADPRHRWGPAPFHYVRPYYDQAWAQMQECALV